MKKLLLILILCSAALDAAQERKPSFASCSYQAANKSGLGDEFKAVKIAQRDYSQALNKVDQDKRDAFDKKLSELIEAEWKKFRSENNLTDDYNKVKSASNKFNSAYKALAKEKRDMLKSSMDDCRKKFPVKEQE